MDPGMAFAMFKIEAANADCGWGNHQNSLLEAKISERGTKCTTTFTNFRAHSNMAHDGTTVLCVTQEKLAKH